MKHKWVNWLLLLVVIGLSLVQAVPAQTAGAGIVYLPIVESRDQGVINKYAEIEPNDSKEQANRIFTNQVYSGRAEDESDYFIFTLGQSGPVTITLNNAPSGAQMLLSTTPYTVVNGAPYVIQKPSLTPGPYVLKIYTPSQSINANWLYTFEVVTNNNAPEAPSSPSPANGVSGQSPTLQLSWMGSDTDGDAVTYDVYFGTDNPPTTLVSNDQNTLSYIPGLMTKGTNYYWKVVAKDEHGLETAGPVWSFRTITNQAPNTPTSPFPINSEIGVNTGTMLSWTGGDPDGDAVTYDVYFGTTNPPTVAVSHDRTTSSYDPGVLALSTTYYWKVVTRDADGLETGGPVWYFQTRGNQAPNIPSRLSPLNVTAGGVTTSQISWTGGDPDGDSVTYDVYFGTTNPPTTMVSSGQSGESYNTGVLSLTTYYWKIVARDIYGMETASPVWQFRVFSSSEIALVPAGNFTRGCDAARNGGFSCGADELPSATIYLDAFYIDKTEVTNAQYAQCVAAGSCTAPSDSSSYTRPSYYGNPTYANYPVIYVNWNQATAFCAWKGKRLPTEAEWEKAARGTDGRAFPWGNAAPTCSLANYHNGSSYCVNDTSAVGSYPTGASPYGALDMAGNVWEWVSDWYDSGYYSVSPSSNPAGPATGTGRVWHGGSWTHYGDIIRVAYRDGYDPLGRNYDIGFRCAVSE